jgi:hypothetical protein
MGEIGGNDYNFMRAAGKTNEQVALYVPKVVQTITAGVEVTNFCLLLDYLCCDGLLVRARSGG